MTAPSARLPNLIPRAGEVDLSALCIPHPSPFVLDLTVDPHQLGEVIEHVSNIEYVRWLDRAAELHADSLGFTRARLLREGRMWFVARHEIDYCAEVWLGDELVIATWVRDMRRVRSSRDYVISRPKDGVIVCRAATLWVLVDLDSRKPVQIPLDMCRAFAPLHDSAASSACSSR